MRRRRSRANPGDLKHRLAVLSSAFCYGREHTMPPSALIEFGIEQERLLAQMRDENVANLAAIDQSEHSDQRLGTGKPSHIDVKSIRSLPVTDAVDRASFQSCRNSSSLPQSCRDRPDFPAALKYASTP